MIDGDHCEEDITCHAGQTEFMNECFDCAEGCAACAHDGTSVNCEIC